MQTASPSRRRASALSPGKRGHFATAGGEGAMCVRVCMCAFVCMCLHCGSLFANGKVLVYR